MFVNICLTKNMLLFIICMFRGFQIFWELLNRFKFWTLFGIYFFNSTYMRVDFYASIFGNWKQEQRKSRFQNIVFLYFSENLIL
jgi:hypothetical protein